MSRPQSTQDVAQDPVRKLIAITPNDSTDNVTAGSTCIVCETAGDAAVVFYDGTEATIPLFAGYNPLSDIKRVKSTSTTATGLWAGYRLEP